MITAEKPLGSAISVERDLPKKNTMAALGN